MKNLKSSVSNMGICNTQQQKDIVKRNNNGMPDIERMMPAASDKGSQPYSRAYGYGEMAGMRLPPNNIACPWVGDIISPCPLPKGKVPCVGIALTSHFAVPKGTAVWLATIV